jgi:4-hydroxybenzoate polyprenyltransferase
MPKALRGLALASHPGPSAVVTLVAVLLAVAVGYSPWRVVLLGAAILSGQLSVGWSNDWIDAARDSLVARRDKPVATGAVSRHIVGIGALVCLAAALALTLLLGAPALAAHAVALASAWSYNAWLKRTVASVVPYVVSFGILPAIVTLGLPAPEWPAWWVIVAGCLLGAAAHVTNVLPDLDTDRATGVRGFGHMLGARAGGVFSFAVLGLAGLDVGLGASLVGELSGWPAAIAIAAAVLTVVIAITGAAMTLRGVRSRWLMRLVMTSAVVIVIGLIAAGPVLTA